MIGKKFWKFDQNRRRYAKGSTGSPIYIEHFVEVAVIGETKLSWIMGTPHASDETPSEWQLKRGDKVPKRDDFDLHGFLTWPQVLEATWKHENRYQLSEAVNRLQSVERLKRILAIVREENHAFLPGAGT